MPWRESSVVEERLRFVVLASRQERTIKDLCAEFGISRQTGYVWLRRYRADGAKAMADQSRRPRQSPRRTVPKVEQRVVELRRRWPDWGAPKLAQLLADEPGGVQLSVRTVHRILERQGLIADADRHTPATQRFERTAPNQLWQMDFKGPQGFNRGGNVGPLSILDDHSRYLLALQHLGSTQMEGVRRTLEATFRQSGLPDVLLMDHGTPWWNGASPWGLTELTVWIMRLGIRLAYSRVCHPQTQGKVERMHGALQRAIKKRRGDPEDQAWLDTFRQEYNHVRPHEALKMATPSNRWHPSPRPLVESLRDWEYPSPLEICRLAGEGQLGWRGRRWEISNALRHMLVGVEVVAETRAIVYFCRTPMRELDLKTGAATPLVGKAIRSLP